MVVALQHQMLAIRGAIEAEQPGGILLLIESLLLAILPAAQLPGAQGVALVGDGVEGATIL